MSNYSFRTEIFDLGIWIVKFFYPAPGEARRWSNFGFSVLLHIYHAATYDF